MSYKFDDDFYKEYVSRSNLSATQRKLCEKQVALAYKILENLHMMHAALDYCNLNDACDDIWDRECCSDDYSDYKSIVKHSLVMLLHNLYTS